MKKHIIIFLAFYNVEHIKKSFLSMYMDDVDYFIIENKSKYSEMIESFFLNEKKNKDNIINYIQFEKNIAANALNITIKDFIGFFRKYEIITFTDGDYYIYDIKSSFSEILNAFNDKNCVISSMSIYWLSNWRQGKNRILGTDYYIEYMKKRENLPIKSIPNIDWGVPSLMTILNKDLHLLENIYYLDINIRNKVRSVGKKWYITTKNLAYHLTDETCYDATTGDEYITWKRSQPDIWKITEVCDYKFLI